MRLVDFFGCIGCNNAALSRELKANAHLFGYLFAERHVSLRLFEAEGKAVAYPIRENEVDNNWVQPLDGSRGRQITNFDSEQVLNFPLVAGGKEPLHTPRPYRLRRRPAPGIQPLSLTRMICPGAPQKLHQAIFNQCNAL